MITPAISSSSHADLWKTGESATDAATLVNAPEAPRPRPAKMYDARRTSPRPVPATYGSE